MNHWRILQGDVRARLAEIETGSVRCCVTSPPYWGLRDYGVEGQLGLESTPEAFVAAMVGVFAEVRRVLADDGTLWLNLGDSYAGSPVGTFNGGGFKDASAKAGTRDLSGIANGSKLDKSKLDGIKQKDLVGIPWMVAFALRADGWYLRSDIIWSKPNPMPESVTDRPTKAHEYIFLLSKSRSYYYDAEAIAARAEGGAHGSPFGMTRNKRTVWTVTTKPYADAHFATFPEDLIEPCILAGSAFGDTVLDPFTGSGTTGAVAIRHQRNFVGTELNPAYVELARKRINAVAPMFACEVA